MQVCLLVGGSAHDQVLQGSNLLHHKVQVEVRHAGYAVDDHKHVHFLVKFPVSGLCKSHDLS